MGMKLSNALSQIGRACCRVPSVKGGHRSSGCLGCLLIGFCSHHLPPEKARTYNLTEADVQEYQNGMKDLSMAVTGSGGSATSWWGRHMVRRLRKKALE